jgi:hypothetical protein
MFKGLRVIDDFQDPRMLEMSTNAANIFQEWKRAKAIAVNSMDDPKERNIHAGILGKIGEYCIRFAGLLAVADLAYDGRPFATHIDITPDHVQRAIKLAEYFYESAWQVYSGVNLSMTAPLEVLRYAGYMSTKPFIGFNRVAEIEFPRDFEKNPKSAARKAARHMKKHVQDYPRQFGAVAK